VAGLADADAAQATTSCPGWTAADVAVHVVTLFRRGLGDDRRSQTPEAILGELVLLGQDRARATGRDWLIDEPEAALILTGAGLLEHWFDAEAASCCPASWPAITQSTLELAGCPAVVVPRDSF
jgi:hypothetical protein